MGWRSHPTGNASAGARTRLPCSPGTRQCHGGRQNRQSVSESARCGSHTFPQLSSPTKMQQRNLHIACGAVTTPTICASRTAGAGPVHLYSTKDIRTEGFDISLGPVLETIDDISRVSRRLATPQVERCQAGLARLDVRSIGRACGRCDLSVVMADLWHARGCPIHNNLQRAINVLRCATIF